MTANAQHDLEQALSHLAKQDPVIRKALRAIGMPKSRRQSGGFATLAKIIVGQQISTKAADAIWRRVKITTGTVSAPNMIATPDQPLRDAGLSASKLKTLKAIASAVDQKSLNFRTLAKMSDQDAKAQLTQIWGIGDWTADIYLMFALGRPDIWPVGDLALRTGWQAITRDKTRIEAEDLLKYAVKWSPYRSAAAVFLWHAVAAQKAL